MYYQQGNKADLIKGKVDVFIDDSVSNFVKMNLSGVPCLLYDKEYNQHWGPVGRIYCLDYKHIKETYIDSKSFNNIFLIFPDIVANWWVWDVKSNKKVSLRVKPFMMETEKYPYFIEKRLYTQLVQAGLLNDLFRIVKSK